MRTINANIDSELNITYDYEGEEGLAGYEGESGATEILVTVAENFSGGSFFVKVKSDYGEYTSDAYTDLTFSHEMDSAYLVVGDLFVMIEIQFDGDTLKTKPEKMRVKKNL
jgi:hypothetical protein